MEQTSFKASHLQLKEIAVCSEADADKAQTDSYDLQAHLTDVEKVAIRTREDLATV